MRRATGIGGGFALLVLAGCTFGMSSAVLRGDLGPGGARVGVRVGEVTAQGPIWRAGPWLVGELIAVDDSVLYLLVRAPEGHDAVLAEVHLGAVTRIEVRDPPVSGLKGPPTRALLAELRATSRHPQGLSPSLTEELLSSLGRDDLTRVRP